LSFARMVSSNNKIVSSRFFEQSQFEQFTMSQQVDPEIKLVTQKNNRNFYVMVLALMKLMKLLTSI
jgi:hypothetical protein